MKHQPDIVFGVETNFDEVVSAAQRSELSSSLSLYDRLHPCAARRIRSNLPNVKIRQRILYTR